MANHDALLRAGIGVTFSQEHVSSQAGFVEIESADSHSYLCLQKCSRRRTSLEDRFAVDAILDYEIGVSLSTKCLQKGGGENDVDQGAERSRGTDSNEACL